jgi:serine/threonine-protein kinase
LAIVIEYVDGDDLETILEKREKLSVSESLHIARQILVALSKIHQNRVKIIHRDLKPNNVMICRDARSTVKLIDFGISTIVDDKTILSNESNIYGASQYVSPEVMKAYYTTANKKSTYLTERIDFFAFGIIFYQMLMGHDPFFKDGFNDTETINLSLHYDIFPMHTENSLIPSAIENIILRCLSYAKNKKIRYYKNADEIIQDIDQVLVKNKSHSFVNPNKRNFNSKQIFVIKNNLDLLIFFRPWFITLFSVITILTITIVLILIYLK